MQSIGEKGNKSIVHDGCSFMEKSYGKKHQVSGVISVHSVKYILEDELSVGQLVSLRL